VDIVSAGATISDRLRVAVSFEGLVESVTVSTTELVPAAVGVPPITPLDEFSVKPAGRPVAAHVYGGVPPAPFSVALYAVFAVPSGSEVAVILRPAAIVRLNVRLAVCG
jgi:hypothetical protein